MKVETYACDLCGVQKKAANRWWKVFLLQSAINDATVGVLTVEWDVNSITKPLARADLLPERADAHLCGSQHVLEWIQKQLLTTNPKEQL